MGIDDPAIKLLHELSRMPRGVSLPEEYLCAVESVESLLNNQFGADKSWVPKARRRSGLNLKSLKSEVSSLIRLQV